MDNGEAVQSTTDGDRLKTRTDQTGEDMDHLDRAHELIEEVRKPLMKAGRTGVVDPELSHKLNLAQQQITKGDPKVSVEVHRPVDTDGEQ